MQSRPMRDTKPNEETELAYKRRGWTEKGGTESKGERGNEEVWMEVWRRR